MEGGPAGPGPAGKRLARNAAELMTLSGQLQAAGVQLELLTGPLTGIYDLPSAPAARATPASPGPAAAPTRY
ncbi:hypothetical protein [Streptomyces sparsogenes]|uniref:Resolvase domain-containing protein n=1 Tax=Streptomyces sparsogenes DSM 40356 TaxID=1331668 RepID=A0A1R1SGD0_9ACTN|nr:hypothetical protein [Streptomyces sparsogenes]OMI37306.1 resolvase domain-containing protein [Streptomyces sparsogenes DSM 40356]